MKTHNFKVSFKSVLNEKNAKALLVEALDDCFDATQAIKVTAIRKPREITRSAVTGRTVKKSYAKKNPKTTVTENRRTSKKKAKRKTKRSNYVRPGLPALQGT